MCSSDEEEEEEEAQVPSDTPHPDAEPEVRPDPQPELEPRALQHRPSTPFSPPKDFDPTKKIEPPLLSDSEPSKQIRSDLDAEYERSAQESSERVPPEQAPQEEPTPPTTQPNNHSPSPLKSPPTTDPKVELLVHSQIAGTQPLIVVITLTTKLKMIREAWLVRQDLNAQAKSEIFFIWRGKRLFDFTTCKSLGINVNEYGELFIEGVQSSELENGQVEVEAVTRQIFENLQKSNQSSTRASNSMSETPRPEPRDEATIRIVLKARGLEDFLLKVRPVSTFGMINRCSHFLILYRRPQHSSKLPECSG